MSYITRKYTSIAVECIAIVVGFGCASIPTPPLDPEVMHKKNLTFCVDGVACYQGAGVVPKQESYQLEIAPREDQNVDRVVFSSCHQTKPYYLSELPNVDLPFFKRVFGKKRRGVSWGYIPDPALEATGDCDLYIFAIDFQSEDHAWAVMRSENPRYTLPARITCDGDLGRDYNGVSVCDARVGTYQKLEFAYPVQIQTPDGCPRPIRLDSGRYKLKVSKGKCPYLIQTEDGKAHSFLSFGWEAFDFKKR